MILQDEIEDILIDEDPEGLIIIGCPMDEYFHEAEMLAAILATDDDWGIHALRMAVATVFQQNFGTHFGYDLKAKAFVDKDSKLRYTHDSTVVIDIAERLYAIL